MKIPSSGISGSCPLILVKHTDTLFDYRTRGVFVGRELRNAGDALVAVGGCEATEQPRQEGRARGHNGAL